MTNPNTLRDSIVTYLRAIPALVTLLGGATRITGYRPEWPKCSSWMEALREQKTASVIVLYRGMRTGGRIPAQTHDFSLLIRDGENADSSDIFAAILNGGFRSPVEPHAAVIMEQDPEIQLRTMPVTETAFLDYWEAPFSLKEKLSF